MIANCIANPIAFASRYRIAHGSQTRNPPTRPDPTRPNKNSKTVSSKVRVATPIRPGGEIR